jgi:hypothetical protein
MSSTVGVHMMTVALSAVYAMQFALYRPLATATGMQPAVHPNKDSLEAYGYFEGKGKQKANA